MCIRRLLRHGQIGQKPDHQTGRGGHSHGPAQDEQGPVKDGADDDLSRPGAAVGGSSRVKDEGTPFKSVLDNRNEAPRVARMAARIKSVSTRAVSREESTGFSIGSPAQTPPPAPRRAIMVSSRGNRPLQGMRLLVRMAMSRSLGSR